MKRPIESDYISFVAYTRALEQYCDEAEKHEPVAWMHSNCTLFNEVTNPEMFIPLYTHPQQKREQEIIEIPIEETLKRAYYYDGNGKWRGSDVSEWERWHAVAKAAKQPTDDRVAFKWFEAPVKTQWGDDMVVADLEIDKDHTVSIYCEGDQTEKVEAMFHPPKREPLTDEQIRKIAEDLFKSEGPWVTWAYARAIEAAHGIKGEA